MFILNAGDINSLYPSFYKDFLDYMELIGTEEPELEILDTEIIKVSDNSFINRCDEYGIVQWEYVTRIPPDPAIPLETRKKRVYFRWNLGPVFTETWLVDWLDRIIGVGGWQLEKDYDNFSFTIVVDTNSTEWRDEVDIIMRTVKPCNMVYSSTIVPLATTPQTKQFGFIETIIDSVIEWGG